MEKPNNRPQRQTPILLVAPSFGHNHQRKIEAMVARGELVIEPGQIQHVNIAHDPWCAINRGGYCNCDPDISVTHEYD